MDPLRIKRVLRQHVKTDALLGVDAVPIASSAAEPLSERQPEPAVELQEPSSRNETSTARGELFPDATYATASLPPQREMLDRTTKLRVLSEMDSLEVKPCRKCGLCEGRLNTVFGEGDADARLMFIGEGPGQTEDETGRPFVGKAGDLLEKMIVAMGLTREQVYIANVVKCRPPNNRAPLPTEVEACWDYLKRQIETISPLAIVTLGGPATKRILQTDKGITAIRGVWARCDWVSPPIPVMPTFHPAYILRSYTPENRKKVWSDLQQVMKRIQPTGA